MMEPIILDRNEDDIKFKRKKLRVVKDVSKDMLHALVDKVEISSNFNREQQNNRCMKRTYAFIIALLLALVILSTVRSERDDTVIVSREDIHMQIISKMYKNSSMVFINSLIEDSYNESGRSTSQQIMSEETSGVVEDDEKTAQIIAKLVKSLDRENALPKIMLMLILWVITGQMIYMAKKHRDLRIAYRNITHLINIENELYFCRKGYIWSIDHKVAQLKLSKTHDPSSLMEDSSEDTSKTQLAMKRIHNREDNQNTVWRQPGEEREGDLKGVYQQQQHQQQYSPFNYHQMYMPYMFNSQMMYHNHMQNHNNNNNGGGDLQNNPEYESESSHDNASCEDDDEASKDQDQNEKANSKHRSYNKRRKMNPDSGSVDAKFHRYSFY